MPAPRPLQLLLSSEHGTNHVPAALGGLFASRATRFALKSNRGWDPGSLWLAQRLSRRFSAPLVVARVSRLVVDPNRSSGHPHLFSEFTAPLPAGTRSALEALRSALTIHKNAPYRGTADGLPTGLRRRLAQKSTSAANSR